MGRNKENDRAWYELRVARWRNNGLCMRCGEPTTINKLTGKPFMECFKHRVRSAKHVHNSLVKKKAGMAK